MLVERGEQPGLVLKPTHFASDPDSQVFVGAHPTGSPPNSLVGARLLGKKPAHPASLFQTNRLREQARSHSFLRCSPIVFTTRTPCGSEPAREEASTSSITVSDKPPSRASPLPQFSAVFTHRVHQIGRAHV